MSEKLVIIFPPKLGKPISPVFLQKTAEQLSLDPHLKAANPEVHRESVPPSITVMLQHAEARERIARLLQAQGVSFEFSS